MIEAAMIWNEPNNKSHWDPVLDPGWTRFSGMARLAGQAIRAVNPELQRVLGGISPIDAGFLRYYRHFYMGLLREDGTPKPALEAYAAHAREMGLCQWFHFEDPRLDESVALMKQLGVRHLRTGLSWADSFRPGALDWFDRQMAALSGFEVTVTFCFTPEHRGLEPHHTSPPQVPEEFAAFCAAMIARYAAPAQAARVRGSSPAVA